MYVQAQYVPTPVRYNSASCVLYAKQLTGYNKPVGLAKNWPVNSQQPSLGAVVIFKYVHVAVITDIASDSFIITEANYIHNKISTRSLPFDDPSIRGYYTNYNR